MDLADFFQKSRAFDRNIFKLVGDNEALVGQLLQR